MGPLVDVAYVAEHRADRTLKVVDATWHLPALGRDARAEFEAEHLPGAVFFDIDLASDHASPLPHMLPSAEAFADYVGGLGIANDDTVVVYDTYGLMSAARVWWMFRAFGHANVAVLDGGSVAWKAAGYPVESGAAAPARATYAVPTLHTDRVRDRAAMLANLTSREAVVTDARSAARFDGAIDEPRPGLRRGHIPESRNLPFDSLVDPHTKRMLDDDALRARFDDAGIDRERPQIFTCGSGVTACVTALVAERLGIRNVAVYDGSWAEWGADEALPIA